MSARRHPTLFERMTSIGINSAEIRSIRGTPWLFWKTETEQGFTTLLITALPVCKCHEEESVIALDDDIVVEITAKLAAPYRCPCKRIWVDERPARHDILHATTEDIVNRYLVDYKKAKRHEIR